MSCSIVRRLLGNSGAVGALSIAVLLARPAAATASSSGSPTIEWIRQFGGPADDASGTRGVLATDESNVYIAGSTRSVLTSADGLPQVNLGGRDAFVRKYNAA